jgi:O-antigen ligase
MVEGKSSGPISLWFRPPALFGFPQVFANALTVAAAMVTALLIAPGRQPHRWWLMGGLVVMVPVLVATTSRGAMAGFAFAALLAVILLRPRWIAPLLLVAAVGVLVVSYTSLRQTLEDYVFVTVRVGNVSERLQYAQEAVEASLERHPLVGAGLNKSDRYNPNPFGYSVHNAFLMAMAETGVLGLILYTALFVFVGLRLIRAARTARDPVQRATLIAIGCGLAALLVHLQTDPFYHVQLTWFFLPLCEAAVLTTAQATRARGGRA